MQANKFISSGGRDIAVYSLPGSGPTILWIAGHTSTMTGGSKSEPLRQFCADKGYRFIAFDYAGWGQSGSENQEWDVDTWTNNTIDVIDQCCEGPVLAVGSSMGGYLMLMAQMARPDRICGLFGLCPGFGSYVTKTGRKQVLHVATNTQLHLDYLTEPVGHHVITRPVPINVPMYLLGSAQDEKVPAYTALNLLLMTQNPQAEIQLINDGDHYFKRPQDITLFLDKLDALRARCL